MTLTKEWLLKTISELEEERDATPGAVNEDAAKALAAMKLALASLGAEPVGYFYADRPGDWYQISDGDRVPDHRRIPLYSSPQSGPVVKLPNEFISNEGIVVQIEKVMAVLAVAGIRYERKGNACRAAMLQGADGNSPAIPYDVRRMDWLVSKTVDVREPMVYGSHSLFWSQTITDEEDDYHATKLREQIDAAMAAENAAAPQQEAE